jgi:hypothetical protein
VAIILLETLRVLSKKAQPNAGRLVSLEVATGYQAGLTGRFAWRAMMNQGGTRLS